MEAVGISIKLTACVILLSIGMTAHAQQTTIDYKFLNNIIDADLNTYNFAADSDYICIIMHEKRCSACGTDICNIIDSAKIWGTGRVVIIDYIQYNIANILPQRALLSREVPCAKEVLFKFYPSGEAAPAISESPTPQLLLVSKGTVRHIDYGSLMGTVKRYRH